MIFKMKSKVAWSILVILICDKRYVYSSLFDGFGLFDVLHESLVFFIEGVFLAVDVDDYHGAKDISN